MLLKVHNNLICIIIRVELVMNVELYPYGFEVSQNDPEVGQFEQTVSQNPNGQSLLFLSQVPTNEDLSIQNQQR